MTHVESGLLHWELKIEGVPWSIPLCKITDSVILTVSVWRNEPGPIVPKCIVPLWDDNDGTPFHDHVALVTSEMIDVERTTPFDTQLFTPPCAACRVIGLVFASNKLPNDKDGLEKLRAILTSAA